MAEWKIARHVGRPPVSKPHSRLPKPPPRKAATDSADSNPLNPHVFGESQGLQRANHVPADVDLPPVTAEAGGGGAGVMVAVPVFAPGGELEWAKPPDVLARVDALGESGFQVQKAVHEALPVQAVEHADSAEPKESGPAEEEVSEAERDGHERYLDPGPDGVSRFHQVGAPLRHARRLPLVEPSEVGPPESAMTRARHVVDRVGVGVMVPVICDPCARSTRAVEDGEENKNLLDHRIQLHRAMRQSAMISDRGPHPAKARHKEGG